MPEALIPFWMHSTHDTQIQEGIKATRWLNIYRYHQKYNKPELNPWRKDTASFMKTLGGITFQRVVDALYGAPEGLSHDEMRTALGGGKWQLPPTLTDAVRKEGKFDLPKYSTIERHGTVKKGTRRYLLSDTFRKAIEPLMEGSKDPHDNSRASQWSSNFANPNRISEGA